MANNEHKPHTVYTRTNWIDNWAEVPYLYANQFSFACGPETQDAELEYAYGQKIRPGAVLATYTPLNLSDKYVKIAVQDGPTWYGVVVETVDQRHGGQDFNAAEVITGKQTFLCRGLEYLLQRKTIDYSVVKDANGEAGETTIGRAIGFNLGEGLPGSVDKIGNQSTQLGNGGSAVFAASLNENVKEWSAYEILFYLLTVHEPQNAAGVDNLGWFANPPIALQTLGGFRPTLHCEGKSFFQVLNELIDRRRMLGWWVYVDPNNEFPEIRLFTFNRNPIALPDGENIIVDNQDPIAWDFDQENQVQVCTLATDNAAKYHRVWAKGDPPGGCFTVEGSGGGGNGLLEPDWSAALQAEYIAGDPGAGALADDDARMNAHQTARTKDKLKKVFRYWRISPTAFTGMFSGKAVWPYDQANTNVCLAFWIPGLRLQDRLPLRLEYDYTNVDTVTNAMKASSKWVYQRPFVFASPSGERSFFLDRPGRGETVETHIKSSGRYWAASLGMQDDNFGIIVNVMGEQQHVLADAVFAGTDVADLADYDGGLDYAYLRATVFAEGDGHVTRAWPQGVVNPGTDTLKELVIYVPGARLDYLVPGTVIDIDVDGTLITSTGGFVRDDTAYLENVARSAYEWYSQSRKSIGVTIHELGFVQGLDQNPLNLNAPTNIFLGALITSIGGADNAETVNSVVTHITFDTLAGTATYLTQFGELDLA